MRKAMEKHKKSIRKAMTNQRNSIGKDGNSIRKAHETHRKGIRKAYTKTLQKQQENIGSMRRNMRTT
jgi:hypothetical protein